MLTLGSPFMFIWFGVYMKDRVEIATNNQRTGIPSGRDASSGDGVGPQSRILV
jgi:hypothetical protein